ncbi:uncharacterized protein ARMOST_16904 [Armillaria ostoyae]|uniref:Uncharacterized protein n=1 Tax=Armillaria ostoyae TaxID=47428 RepID=A0A284RXI4_ARMOS|nr:uncharacterized protein ARMOST_16904 [Armillaria ostoyae]
MLPHFGEYVAFKLDPVASLEALNDPEAEVSKACKALETKTDVSYVTHSRTQCRVRNDVIIGGAWPQPKYGLSNEDQVLLNGDYFDEDSDRRELLKTEQKPLANDSSIGDNVAADVSDGRETPPVTLALERDTESQYCQSINDPWDFFRELEALKRIEEDYSERVKAKTQTAIDRARQRDEELNARLQSKMPKRVTSGDGGSDSAVDDGVLD